MKRRAIVPALALLCACSATPPAHVTQMRELKVQCFREQMALHGGAAEMALQINETCHRWAARAAR